MNAVRKGCCDNSFKYFILKQNMNFIITQDVAEKKTTGFENRKDLASFLQATWLYFLKYSLNYPMKFLKQVPKTHKM